MGRKIASVAALLVVAAVGYGLAAIYGVLGRMETPGTIARKPLPEDWIAGERSAQERAARAIGAETQKEILFGDLHVHTTYSMDAFLMSLPLMQGEGTHPPADACDFARYCAELDFFSLNDHAESLTPKMWSEIKDSIRQCNAVAGNPDSPDLVAFLGWEWTQMADAPQNHYGHKNVVLRDTEEDRTPARPIAALGNGYRAMRDPRGNLPLFALSVRDFANRQRYLDLLTLRDAVMDMPLCDPKTPVRELPASCSEAVATPRELFEKLDDWGFASLVIPHGNAWGNTSPAGIDWERQLAGGQHDPKRQTLIEVYSGHGNSEQYRPWRHLTDDSPPGCPEPSDGFTPDCQQAGEIIRKRCLAAGFDAGECEARAAEARHNFVAAARGGLLTIPGEHAEDWLDSGQCTDCFEPAFRYRPGGSVQNALAVSGAGVPGATDDPEQRFRFGLIASSDNHTARPGTGYKEFRARGMTDTPSATAVQELRSLLREDSEPQPESTAVDPADVIWLPGGGERLASFFYTGGLAAVHAEGRDRQSIWQALERKEVYGTSGPRLLLWFDLLNAPAGEVPMGSQVEMAAAPRFRVRALGSREQKPGCPEHSVHGLAPERLAALCLGECYNPGDTRRRIERIEVVRIRPRQNRDEDVAVLIEDPWRSFACPLDAAGCAVEFEDVEFSTAERDSVYYVRAVEAPSPQVNGDPLRCDRDPAGNCIATHPCRSDGGSGGKDADECLSPAGARAWSSPIFVDRKPTTTLANIR